MCIRDSSYTNEENDFSDANIQYTSPDNTPVLGKVQNQINDVWSNIYSTIFD